MTTLTSYLLRAAILCGLCQTFLLGGGTVTNLLTTTSEITLPASGVGYTAPLDPFALFVINSSQQPVTITGFAVSGLNAADFALSANTCPVAPNSLAPGSTCYAGVLFTPSAVGLRSANIVISVEGGPAQSVVLFGEGQNVNKSIAFSYPTATFPQMQVETPLALAAQGYAILVNAGNTPVNLKSVSIQGEAAQDFHIGSTNCPIPGILVVGANCILGFSFDPTAVGPRTASLEVSDDAGGGRQTLPLFGVGSPALKELSFVPAAIMFPGVLLHSSAQGYGGPSNSGAETITIKSIDLVGPNAAEFSLIQNGCGPVPFQLSGYQSCSFEIQFSPTVTGQRRASVRVVDDAPGSPHLLPLEGSEAPAATHLSWDANPTNFGIVQVGQQGAIQAVALKNAGNVDAQISIQLQGSEAQEFTIVQNYCGPLLGPGNDCTVNFAFTPLKTGLRVATLVAHDAVSGSAQSVLLAGSGSNANPQLIVNQGYFNPEIVGVTSPPFLFNVYTSSATPVTLSGLTLTGPAGSDFNIYSNNCVPGLILTQVSSCAVQISFTPSALGARLAGLNIGFVGGQSTTLPLTAWGLPLKRSLSWSTDYGPPLLFGGQNIGVSSQGVAYLINSGTEPVSIADIRVKGQNPKDFVIVGNQCPISPAMLPTGQGCQVIIQFQPLGLGTRTASLEAVDNATGSPQAIAAIGAGISIRPALDIPFSTLQFSAQPLGSSIQSPVFISPFSGPPVNLSGVQIVGRNAGDFQQINNCPPKLVPPAQCSIAVTFKPTVAGPRQAELRLIDDAEGSPQVVPLSGNGMNAMTNLVVFPNPVLFTQPMGLGSSATVSVELASYGTKDVIFTGFEVAGADRADFGIQSNGCPLSPTPLPVNSQCFVNITFNPQGLGTRIASLRVFDNSPGGEQSLPLAGVGVNPVKLLTASPSAVSFGSQPVGSTGFSSVSVANTGTVPVTIKSLAVTGANGGEFTISENTCYQITPGSSCPIYLSFLPLAAGPRSAVLEIDSDASPLLIGLSGTGQ